MMKEIQACVSPAIDDKMFAVICIYGFAIYILSDQKS